jgi:hypothetical protein
LKNKGRTWEVPIIQNPPAPIHHQGIGISSELGALSTELVQYLQFEHFLSIAVGDFLIRPLLQALFRAFVALLEVGTFQTILVLHPHKPSRR